MISKQDDKRILIHREAALGWVTINRPAARNALTTAMWGELATVIRALAADEQIRVIILRGTGDKSFISGADIADLNAQLARPQLDEEGYRFTLTLLDAISDAPKPVIAMINGHCFGGGVLIALTCDLRIASEQSQFGIPAVKLGVAYPPQQGVTRLVRTIGATHAADLLLSGRIVDANEAMRIGLVNRLVPASELEHTTREYALALSQNAPLAMTAHKLAIQQALSGKQAPELITAAVNRCYQSADCREGLAAFLEKRPPQFEGR